MDYSKYDASVFALMDDGVLVYNNEIDIKDFNKIKFIMLTNEYLNPEYVYDKDNTIFLSIDCTRQMRDIARNMNKSIKWFNSDKRFPKIKTHRYNDDPKKIPEIDFDGYANTQDIILNCPKTTQKKASKEEIIPAVMCVFNTIERYRGIVIHGYLPAISQIYSLAFNINDVDDILKICRRPLFKIRHQRTFENTTIDILDDVLWSSTIEKRDKVFIYEKGNPFIREMNQVKTDLWLRTLKVLPFYKITI